MLTVAKLHHYSKKEKSTFRRNNFVGSFGGTAEGRDKNLKDLGVNEKGQTKEGQTEGMIYDSTRPSLKN